MDLVLMVSSEEVTVSVKDWGFQAIAPENVSRVVKPPRVETTGRARR